MHPLPPSMRDFIHIVKVSVVLEEDEEEEEEEGGEERGDSGA